MIQISLCMIVKNEEEILGRCLESIKTFVDEIIIVDTGSTDKTKEVAEQYGAMIYDFEWCDDFSKARNHCFSKATKDYIFWLDADDYVTEENLNKLHHLKSGITLDLDVVSMHYSLTRNTQGETTYSLRRNRLVKRSLGFKWKGRIHEYLEVVGRTEHSDVYIHHGKDRPHTDRNLSIFKIMQEEGDVFSDRDLFYFANELYCNGFYEEAIRQYYTFIQRGTGWIEDLKTATANLIQCFTMTQQEEKKMDVILNSYKWGIPRADICCRMAEYFMVKQEYRSAIFWYKTACQCVPGKENMGGDMKDYYTWIPNIQLCVCYSLLGEYDIAHYYNEKTAIYVPNSPKVEYNRKFLRGKLKESGKEEPVYETLLIERRN